MRLNLLYKNIGEKDEKKENYNCEYCRLEL